MQRKSQLPSIYDLELLHLDYFPDLQGQASEKCNRMTIDM